MTPLNLRHLRDAGIRPRVHGNGFLQLELNSNDQRLHIWGHPELPRQSTNTAIHDHTWGFTSTVLVGRLININYHVVPAGRHPQYKIYMPRVREGEDTILIDTEERANAIIVNTHTILANKSYRMNAGDFHETIAPGPAASIMTKDYSTQSGVQHARVLVPIGYEPDNEFNRNSFNDTLLWGIVKEVCGDLVEI